MRSHIVMLLLLACGDKEPQVQDSQPELPQDDSSPDSEPVPLTDADKDGYLSDVDCNDNSYKVHPDAEEECDGIDQDCDGAVDEDYDLDQDGAFSGQACEAGTDCDDADPQTYAGAAEVPYDSVDQDCDGQDLLDVDGDRYEGVDGGGNDCDDADPNTHPGATETPKDGIDQDCDGADEIDGDGDGSGDQALGGDDCDDDDAAVHPGAMEWYNDNLDNNCDGKENTTSLLTDAPASIEGTSGKDDLLGRALALCDLDDDGLADLVVGAPFASTYAGEVGIFYGKGYASWTADMAMSAADTLIKGDGYDFIGFGAACADFDGDGYMDLAIGRGEINFSPYRTDLGVLFFYGDGAAMPASLSDAKADAELTLDTGAPNKGTVYSVGLNAGDSDGDGDAELVLVVGHPDLSYNDGGEIVLLVEGGRYAGKVKLSDYITHSFLPEQSAQLSGAEILGDYGGDGQPDLAILSGDWLDTADADSGAADTGVAEGRVDLLNTLPASGEDLALGANRSYGWTSRDATLSFGLRVVEGDFNGDGAQDLAVSSSGANNEGLPGTGGLFTFVDPANSLSALDLDPESSANGVLYGDQLGAYFAYALAVTGDVDGDGADDLLASAPGGALSAVGRITLLSGQALLNDPLTIEDATLWALDGEDPDDINGFDLLSGGDIDGDGVQDVVIMASNWDSAHSADVLSGKVYVYFSSLW